LRSTKAEARRQQQSKNPSAPDRLKCDRHTTVIAEAAARVDDNGTNPPGRVTTVGLRCGGPFDSRPAVVLFLSHRLRQK
jgi:hypothetical protein